MQIFNSKIINYLVIFLLVLAPIMLSGCAQEQQEDPGTNVKGIKEKGVEKIAEPTVKVKLKEGQTKQVKMEEYVAGVVAGEMKKDWPTNAYGAQAILARTFAMKTREEEGTEVISGSHREAQAYKPENITDKIRKAVEKTKGEIIVYEGNYIKSWFHSSAAGRTTSAKVGLAYKKEEPEYITSVKSPDQHAPDDVKSWSVTYTQSEIIAALKEQAGIEDIEKVKEIKITKKDHTERAINLKINYNGGEKEMKAANFRTAIGPEKLKSTLIKSIDKSGDKFTFKGSGYGHGVGMSQWGAYAMAKDGNSPEEIIDHYFEGIEIIKKWE